MSEIQMSLDFDPPKARLTDPRTSKDAAKSVKTGTIRALILNQLSTNNLATFQIAEILDMYRDSISPHMKPLERLGLIRRSGQLVKNPKTGKNCEVWEKICT